ncbi:hypothetical protein [Massilia sp. SYSU DXS3249]
MMVSIMMLFPPRRRRQRPRSDGKAKEKAPQRAAAAPFSISSAIRPDQP